MKHLGLTLTGWLIAVSVQAQSSFTFTDTVYNVGQELLLPRLVFIGCNGLQLDPDQEHLPDSIAAWLMAHPELCVELEIHSDLRGNADKNRAYTRQRGEWIRNVLVERGVEKNRITVKGCGEDQPLIREADIAPFKTDKRQYERLHQQNRRDILRITTVGSEH